MATAFEKHYRRVGMAAEDLLVERKTGTACEYVGHPTGVEMDAVMIFAVQNTCCNNEEYSSVRACWYCLSNIVSAEEFACRCGQGDSSHSLEELTFRGEIKPSVAA